MKLTAETTVFDETAVQNKFSELVVDQDGIRTEVGRKVGNDEVISRINQSAESIQIQASKVAIEADNFITAYGSDGVRIHPKNDNDNYYLMSPDGAEIFKGGVSVAQYGDTATIGKVADGYSRTEIAGSGVQFKRRVGSTDTVLANIGYGSGNASSGTAVAPYYTFGQRSSSTVGNYSTTVGFVDATGYSAFAQGNGKIDASGSGAFAGGLQTGSTSGASIVASGDGAFAHGYAWSSANTLLASGLGSFANGYTYGENYIKATGRGAVAMGDAHDANIRAEANGAIAIGLGAVATSANQIAFGRYNVNSSSNIFSIGCGTADTSRKNAFAVDTNGDISIGGSFVGNIKIGGFVHAENSFSYGTCSTAASTSAKTVTVANSNFTLQTGATVLVKFTNNNSATAPTLNVNGTGAKAIFQKSGTVAGSSASSSWYSASVVPLVYDGSHWQLL